MPSRYYLRKQEAYGAARPRKIGYKPPDPTELERARIQRLNEIKMWDIIREIVFYSFFLWILMVISYRNRSPDSYYYKDSMEKMIIKNNDTLQWFTKISNTEEFWLWARSGLVNSLRATNYYNNAPPLLLRGFIGDKVSRIMGFATMRQLRVKQGLCSTIDVMSTTILECNEDYSMFNEDKMSYGASWSPVNPSVNRKEYTYTPASNLNSYPYWGRLAVYGGGGYVVELKGSKHTLEKAMVTLEKEKWIDKYTRAIFVEFTVYNPQVNLFAISTIIAEFQSSGGVIASYRFEPAMLLPYMTSVMLFQVFCEIIYFCFTIVFIVKEFRNFLKQRSRYFKSFWNLIELSIISMSISSIVVYFYRLIVTNNLTSEFKRNHGNEYMKFQYVGYWNELFSYMIGWLVFFGSLKFLKLLRFNKRMSLLGSTLKNGAHCILHFSLMFWILFLAFMQLFYLTFMSTSPAFSTFIKSAESGILMMMGKFDIYGMLMVEPILTQVYVFFFVVTITFILVNMFLSILNETFGSVRVDIKKQNNDYEIVEFMVTRFKKWVGFGDVPTTLPPTTATSETSRGSFPKGDTVEEFPDRIDRLLNSISNVYTDDNLEALIESKGESKKLALKHMMKSGNAGEFTEDGPTKVHTH